LKGNVVDNAAIVPLFHTFEFRKVKLGFSNLFNVKDLLASEKPVLVPTQTSTMFLIFQGNDFATGFGLKQIPQLESHSFNTEWDSESTPLGLPLQYCSI
jgi:hypothetical protein